MTTNTLKAAPAASVKELKNEKPAKAKRMLVGVDAHLRGCQAARKIDSGVIGVVENFRSEEELELYVAKQTTLAEQVVVVYEAGPLCYTLYRKLTAAGVLCYVCAPDSGEQRKKRRKNNKIDARSLTSKLFNYLNGDQNALQLARVPTEAQEQLRMASRQHDQLVEERKRLGAKGNAMLLSQALGAGAIGGDQRLERQYVSGLVSLRSMKFMSADDFIEPIPAALRIPVGPDWD